MSFKAGSIKLPREDPAASRKSFKAGSIKLPREDPAASISEIDPYWGRPADMLDEVPLSARRQQMEPDYEGSRRSVANIVPDLKLGALIKHHLRDWLVIILCIILDAVLNVIHPYARFVGINNISDVSFPHKKNTIPLWAVPEIAIGIPLIIFICFFLKTRNTRDFHHALLGLLTAVGVTAVFTDAIKDGVGRARPDFLWRCNPDGVWRWDNLPYQRAICTGDAGTIREGHKSFPSGHTSWSFSGLSYLSFYIAGKVTLFDRRGFTSRVLLVLLPLLGAAMVAVSRVSDYWHHWQDVTVGALLGFVIAYISYKQHFPEFSDNMAARPYPHIHHKAPQPPGQPRSDPGDWGTSTQPPGRPNGAPYDLESARI